MPREAPLSQIPTHVITGFLGAGKTTAILHLLRSKPAGERWAVLVNEFGEIGIDGTLLRGALGTVEDVFIGEVPGGCMCCQSRLPMQVALNRLLREARPHRLLIEPSGLGHPAEVLATLRTFAAQGVLELRATLTLVDARRIGDPRLTRHPVFLQQLQVADRIVASQADQYGEGDLEALQRFLAGLSLADRPCSPCYQGALELAWLEASVGTPSNPGVAAGSAWLLPAAPAERRFHWQESPERPFHGGRLTSVLCGVDASRLKGVFRTEEGVVAFNAVEGVLTRVPLDSKALEAGEGPHPGSVLEVIDLRSPPPEVLANDLLACLVEASQWSQRTLD